MPNLDRALDEFCNNWWPCKYRLKDKRCINTKTGLSKGHQDKSGRPFGSGPFESYFIADRYRPTWHHCLRLNLDQIRQSMQRTYSNVPRQKVGEAQFAADLHLRRLNEFYENLGNVEDFSSNAACLCCLRELPEHPLPCGHVLCSLCVRGFGQPRSKMVFTFNCCPMHPHNRWDVEHRISLKPYLAGTRVLTLDG